MSGKYTLLRMLLVVVLAGGCAFQALANEEQPVAVDARADLIRDQQAAIRADATAKRGRFADMDQATRDRLLQTQDKVLALLDGKSSSKELSVPDQLLLFNSLEEISAIVNTAEDGRMVCERVRRVGSHRTENICKTVAQRRAERQQSRDAIDRRDTRCLTADCGAGDTTRAEGW